MLFSIDPGPQDKEWYKFDFFKSGVGLTFLYQSYGNQEGQERMA